MLSRNRKKTWKTIISQAYQSTAESRCCSWGPPSGDRIAWYFSTLLCLKQGQVNKLIFENDASEIGFPLTLTSGAFLNQKRNKQTSHELQKNLDSRWISFCTSSRKRQLKTSQDDTKLCQLQLSVNKLPDAAEIFRMNSPVKFLTNRSIEIGLGAWPTRDYGEKRQACKSRLNFCVRGQFEIKIFKVRLMNTTYFICILKTLNLSLRSFEK